MRISKRETTLNNFSILTLDDDPIITSTIQAHFQRAGYLCDMEHEPYRAIERVREGTYDILLLDYLMSPICGDQVVEEIRKFNQDIYIGYQVIPMTFSFNDTFLIQFFYNKIFNNS